MLKLYQIRKLLSCLEWIFCGPICTWAHSEGGRKETLAQSCSEMLVSTVPLIVASSESASIDFADPNDEVTRLGSQITVKLISSNFIHFYLYNDSFYDDYIAENRCIV